MKRSVYVIIMAVIPISLCFGQSLEDQNADSNRISIGIRDQLHSEVLGEEREIWVHVPESSIYGGKYPVLYLLDGAYHFESVVGIVKANVINRLIPEMIIVAIPNTNRYRDLTTAHIGDDSNPSGGGEHFTKFIGSELIPYIEGKYPAIEHRTFVGHSLGGLLVANTLVKYPGLFDNYLAIDPSISWGPNQLLGEARTLMKEVDFSDKSLYVAVANTTNDATMSFEQALQDTTTATLHLRSIVEFSKAAKSNEQLASDWKYYPNETHGTLPVVAEHHALRFLFSWYEFKNWNEFYMPEPRLSGEELVGLIVAHHDKVSDKLRHDYLPDEFEVNRLAYMYLSRGDAERAFPFFELNVKNYPEHANAFDAMGDYYSHIGDQANALKAFSKAIALGGVDGTKEKLEALKQEKE